jgi:hypothetical protein
MSSITFRRGSGGAVQPAAAGPVLAPASVTPAADSDREKAGGLLRDLYEYLQENIRQHPALMPALPLLSAAVAAHRSGQAADPFDGVRTVHAAIEAARRTDPSTPEA